MTKLALGFVLGAALAGGVTAVKAASDKKAAMTAQEARVFELACERARSLRLAADAALAEIRAMPEERRGQRNMKDGLTSGTHERVVAARMIEETFCISASPSSSR